MNNVKKIQKGEATATVNDIYLIFCRWSLTPVGFIADKKAAATESTANRNINYEYYEPSEPLLWTVTA